MHLLFAWNANNVKARALPALSAPNLYTLHGLLRLPRMQGLRVHMAYGSPACYPCAKCACPALLSWTPQAEHVKERPISHDSASHTRESTWAAQGEFLSCQHLMHAVLNYRQACEEVPWPGALLVQSPV